jgi:hypothetical protein
MGYINLADYMLMRLLIFSWKKCSVVSIFIEEVAFECAIDIVSRTTARHIYNLGVELSNAFGSRHMDFVTFMSVAESARLFSKISTREDADAGRNEFTLALDKNLLPLRYNKDINKQLFRLVDDGIDIITFIFYDNMLKLFDIPNPQKKYSLTQDEFIRLLSDPLFPQNT